MRVVVVGAGRMGRRHIHIVRSLGFELVGVADSQPDALEAASVEFGLGSNCLCSDAMSMLRNVRHECAVIATTAPSHCELTCAAAENGAKFILCEKPMATSLEDCDRMIESCQANDVRLSVNHPSRHSEYTREAVRMFSSPAFGELTSITVVGGNFGLAMNGCHYFEIFSYLTKEPPVEVTGWLSPDPQPNPRGVQFEDRAGAVRVVTAGGKRLYVEAGQEQGHGKTIVYAGRYGQLIVNELTGVFSSSIRQPEYQALPTTRYGMPSDEVSRKLAPMDAVSSSKAVLRALLDGGDTPTAEDGRRTVEVLVAAYVSSENGHRRVRLDQESLPYDRRFPWA